MTKRLARLGCPTAKFVGGTSRYLCQCAGACPADPKAPTFAHIFEALASRERGIETARKIKERKESASGRH